MLKGSSWFVYLFVGYVSHFFDIWSMFWRRGDIERIKGSFIPIFCHWVCLFVDYGSLVWPSKLIFWRRRPWGGIYKVHYFRIFKISQYDFLYSSVMHLSYYFIALSTLRDHWISSKINKHNVVDLFSHTMPKMNFHDSHRFSWEKNTLN